MSETPIVFLDTETDGVHPDRKVWEVAMIRRDGDRQEEVSFFVDLDLSTADPFGLKVGRFYDRHPLGRHLSAAAANDSATSSVWEDADWSRRGVLSRNEAAMRVARWTHGAHIVGMVPNFDTEVLGRLIRRAGLIPTWHYHLIDVSNLAVGYLHGTHPDLSRIDAAALPWRSDYLSSTCGVEPPTEEERHTALGDTRWAMRLYDHITGGTGQQ